MKKAVVIIFILFFVVFIPSFAFAMVHPVNYNTARPIRAGVYTNYTNAPLQARPVNNVVIRTTPHSGCVHTPPPPPPQREVYHYSDFAGTRRFHRRSYYIPSYCLPTSQFYNNNHNPFCSQYRPYGSNMYLSF